MRARAPARIASRVPALLAALALTAPSGARAGADAGATWDAGAAGADAADPGAGTGVVKLEGRASYTAIEVDGAPRADVLAQETFVLPVGEHRLRLTRPDGSAFDTHVVVRRDETVVVARIECEAPLGGVAPPIETRPSGCCGGSATSNESARGYGLAASVALGVVIARRRRRGRD